MIFNDMINANVRSGDAARTQAILSSGLIERQVRWVAELRRLDIPIFWVRVERRADRKDRIDALTDQLISADGVPAKAITRGPQANNIDELPIRPEDHEILKPRFNPFSHTDLDLQLRARHIDTILIGGIATDKGVEGAARTGFDFDYNVVVLSDLCWAPDSAAQDHVLTKSLPAYARVMTSDRALQLLR